MKKFNHNQQLCYNRDITIFHQTATFAKRLKSHLFVYGMIYLQTLPPYHIC